MNEFNIDTARNKTEFALLSKVTNQINEDANACRSMSTIGFSSYVDEVLVDRVIENLRKQRFVVSKIYSSNTQPPGISIVVKWFSDKTLTKISAEGENE